MFDCPQLECFEHSLITSFGSLRFTKNRESEREERAKIRVCCPLSAFFCSKYMKTDEKNNNKQSAVFLTIVKSALSLMRIHQRRTFLVQFFF